MIKHPLFISFCLLGTGFLQANAYADIFKGTPHQLIAQHSNKCMDISSPQTKDGSSLIQKTCTSAISQTWQAVQVQTNLYKIVSTSSKMCLDVNGASQQNGALVKQSVCHGGANQLWSIKTIADNIFQFVSKNSGRCLDVSGANTSDNIPLQQWDCGTGNNQKWFAQDASLKPSAPIVINNQSNVIISNVKITNPAGPCILIKGKSSNITIKDSELGPCKTDLKNPQSDLSNVGAGVFVTGTSSAVSVTNVNIHDTDDSGVTIFYGNNYTVNNNRVSNTASQAIKAQGLTGVTIQNNTVNNSYSGVYVSRSSNVKVLNNSFTHIQGKPRANFIQFNGVTGASNRIMCNTGLQDAYGTLGSLDSTEDNISVYSSSGTIADPLLVVGNKLKNGGPSTTGSGIMLGDNGGSNIIARDNVVVTPGNVGIAVSGGTNIKVLNNKIFSSLTLITNNAIPVWNYNAKTVTCDNIAVSGNQVNWTNRYGPESRVWRDGSCTNVQIGANTFLDSTITPALFDTYQSGECK